MGLRPRVCPGACPAHLVLTVCAELPSPWGLSSPRGCAGSSEGGTSGVKQGRAGRSALLTPQSPCPATRGSHSSPCPSVFSLYSGKSHQESSSTIHTPTNLAAHLPVRLSIQSSIHPSSTHLSVPPSIVHPSIHPSSHACNHPNFY